MIGVPRAFLARSSKCSLLVFTLGPVHFPRRRHAPVSFQRVAVIDLGGNPRPRMAGSPGTVKNACPRLVTFSDAAGSDIAVPPLAGDAGGGRVPATGCTIVAIG